MPDERLVYSTELGDLRAPGGGRRRGTPAGPSRPVVPADGVVRVFREKGGRGGKVVTLVRGLPHAELTAVASDLKRLCGAGGAVKDGAVEVQGDHREKIARRLETRGHRVKLAGG